MHHGSQTQGVAVLPAHSPSLPLPVPSLSPPPSPPPYARTHSRGAQARTRTRTRARSWPTCTRHVHGAPAQPVGQAASLGDDTHTHTHAHAHTQVGPHACAHAVPAADAAQRTQCVGWQKRQDLQEHLHGHKDHRRVRLLFREQRPLRGRGLSGGSLDTDVAGVPVPRHGRSQQELVDLRQRLSNVDRRVRLRATHGLCVAGGVRVVCTLAARRRGGPTHPPAHAVAVASPCGRHGWSV